MQLFNEKKLISVQKIFIPYAFSVKYNFFVLRRVGKAICCLLQYVFVFVRAGEEGLCLKNAVFLSLLVLNSYHSCSSSNNCFLISMPYL